MKPLETIIREAIADLNYALTFLENDHAETFYLAREAASELDAALLAWYQIGRARSVPAGAPRPDSGDGLPF